MYRKKTTQRQQKNMIAGVGDYYTYVLCYTKYTHGTCDYISHPAEKNMRHPKPHCIYGDCVYYYFIIIIILFVIL